MHFIESKDGEHPTAMSIHSHGHRVEAEESTTSATIGNSSPLAGSLADDKVEPEKAGVITSKEVPVDDDVVDSLLDDIPDGGMRAWLVVLGVRMALNHLNLSTHLHSTVSSFFVFNVWVFERLGCKLRRHFTYMTVHRCPTRFFKLIIPKPFCVTIHLRTCTLPIRPLLSST